MAAARPRRRQVLLIQIRGLPEAEQHERWCIQQTGGLGEDEIHSINVVHKHDVSWDDLRNADALVIGGSGDHSVTSDDPFLPALTAAVSRAVDEGRPVFGICWGHQFLARALGGRVITDTASKEVGTYDVALTPDAHADPLFSGLPPTFAANLVHHDRVVELPPGARELAFSETCRMQAMRIDGKPVYGTQFHGEMNAQQLRHRLLMYRDEYVKNEHEVRAVLERLRPTDAAESLLKRFLELYT